MSVSSTHLPSTSVRDYHKMIIENLWTFRRENIPISVATTAVFFVSTSRAKFMAQGVVLEFSWGLFVCAPIEHCHYVQKDKVLNKGAGLFNLPFTHLHRWPWTPANLNPCSLQCLMHSAGLLSWICVCSSFFIWPMQSPTKGWSISIVWSSSSVWSRRSISAIINMNYWNIGRKSVPPRAL